jgi:glycosyltransferase involved in cell wall biosynthesis
MLRHFLKDSVKRFVRPGSRLYGLLRSADGKIFSGSTQRVAALPLSPGAKVDLPFGVNVSGYIHGEFGVAEAARASLKSLSAVEIPHVMNNVHTHAHRMEDRTFSGITSENPFRVNLIHVNADQVNEFIRQKGYAYLQGRYNIGCWYWELSHFPSKWRSAFNIYNEIWAASEFCRESILGASPVPVIKMTSPILVDEACARPNRRLFGIPDGKFVFGFVFDYLSVMERKNPLGLVKAFQLAFANREDVMLLIKTINVNCAPEKAARLIKSSEGYPNIHFINEHISREEMMSLITSLDSYVSLHRSEGFGIGMAQAMYLGKPVIATGYSGNLEFMNPECMGGAGYRACRRIDEARF